MRGVIRHGFWRPARRTVRRVVALRVCEPEPGRERRVAVVHPKADREDVRLAPRDPPARGVDRAVSGAPSPILCERATQTQCYLLPTYVEIKRNVERQIRRRVVVG